MLLLCVTTETRKKTKTTKNALLAVIAIRRRQRNTFLVPCTEYPTDERFARDKNNYLAILDEVNGEAAQFAAVEHGE